MGAYQSHATFGLDAVNLGLALGIRESADSSDFPCDLLLEGGVRRRLPNRGRTSGRDQHYRDGCVSDLHPGPLVGGGIIPTFSGGAALWEIGGGPCRTKFNNAPWSLRKLGD